MLVLTREVGTKIRIDTSDGPIEVTVNDIRGRRARLGIDAPRECRIMRTEVKPQDPEPVA